MFSNCGLSHKGTDFVFSNCGLSHKGTDFVSHRAHHVAD